MAYIDLDGLNQFWHQIVESFARKRDALASIALSGTSLTQTKVDGSSGSSIDLNSTFATDSEAAGSMSLSGTTLSLKSVSNSTLSSINLGSTFATDAEAGHSLSRDGKKVYLKDVNGNNLNYVTLPDPDLSDYVTSDWVKNHCGFSLGVSGSTGSGSSVVIYLYNYYGAPLNYVVINF